MKRRDSAHMATARGDIRGCDAASRTKSHACQFELNACAVITQSLQTERSELERVFAGKRSNLEYDCVSLLRRALEPGFPGLGIFSAGLGGSPRSVHAFSLTTAPAMQPSVRRPRNRSVQARTDDRRDRSGGGSGIDVAPCCGPASAGLASNEPRQTMRTLLWGDDARGRERGGMRVWPTPNKYQGGPHDVEHLAA